MFTWRLVKEYSVSRIVSRIVTISMVKSHAVIPAKQSV